MNIPGTGAQRVYSKIFYISFTGQGEPPGGAWGNDFRRVPPPMGHLRNSELPTPPSPFFFTFFFTPITLFFTFFLNFFKNFFDPHHPGRTDHHKSAMNVNVQKCGAEILQKMQTCLTVNKHKGKCEIFQKCKHANMHTCNTANMKICINANVQLCKLLMCKCENE